LCQIREIFVDGDNQKLFKVLNDLNSSESYEIEVKEEENKDESMEKSAELSKTKDTTKEEMKGFYNILLDYTPYYFLKIL